jgi:hypothetical protein
MTKTFNIREALATIEAHGFSTFWHCAKHPLSTQKARILDFCARHGITL